MSPLVPDVPQSRRAGEAVGVGPSQGGVGGLVQGAFHADGGPGRGADRLHGRQAAVIDALEQVVGER